jgi:peptidoglycan hydrolase-like protein with peptidoglycan-binding domain
MLRTGDEGPEVEALQVRLTELGYRPGTPDGRYGASTASAVMAFQKHEGLGRDGVAGPEVLGRIATPQGAGPRAGLPVPRIEVDLDRQIAFVVDAAGTVTIVNVSSGNGETYRHPDGYSAVAYTPTGTYAVERRIDGAEKAPLGTLYRPLYFKGGWAVHGSTSVPGYPASHGCVRISYADQDFIWDAIPTGAAVILYGTSPGSPDEAAPGA